MISQESYEALKLYRFYKNNTLCFSGGVMDQPNRYLEAMQVIEDQVKLE